jgi:hypothetical protein
MNKTAYYFLWITGITLCIVGGWYLWNYTNTVDPVKTILGVQTQKPTIIFPNTNPGGTNTPGVIATSTPTTTPNELVIQREPILTQIYNDPVAGSTFITKNNSTYARLVDRTYGYVYDISLDSNNLERITNTLIPKTLDAQFTREGDGVVLRSQLANSKIQTFTGAIKQDPSNSTNGVLSGRVDSPNPYTVAVLNNKNILYLSGPGQSVGVLLGATSTQGKRVFSSNFSEWTALWGTTSEVFLSTKPSRNKKGGVFKLNTNTQAFEQLFDSMYGLVTTPSPFGNLILLSDTNTQTPRLQIGTVATSELRELGLQGLADKCSWASAKVFYCALPRTFPTGYSYPDDWYRGLVTFSDVIWSVDVTYGIANIVYDPLSSSGNEFDIDELHVRPSGKELLFRNKKDGSLWLLKLP